MFRLKAVANDAYKTFSQPKNKAENTRQKHPMNCMTSFIMSEELTSW